MRGNLWLFSSPTITLQAFRLLLGGLQAGRLLCNRWLNYLFGANATGPERKKYQELEDAQR